MRFFYLIFFILICSERISGQNLPAKAKGQVSYISSTNIYVKFSSTKSIQIGDTLYMTSANELKPVMTVNSKSSISCVCSKLENVEGIEVSDEIIFYRAPVKKKEPAVENLPEPPTETIPENTVPVEPVKEEEEEMFKQNIRGRVSVASYSNLSETNDDVHRMRYAFSFRGNNLKNSRFSTDNYITFRHTAGEWGEVQENLSQALKIYSLSAKYDFSQSSSISVGRKINRRISSVGAIDGLQYEKGFGQFRLGAIAGSRPDFTDYGVNLNLFQTGVYIGHDTDPGKNYRQSTLGVMEQRNKGNVDRRFTYFQHSGTLVKNMNLFTSFEFDLYENINGAAKNKLSLTNLFVSLRYRVSRKFSLSTSYDNRRNIIFYESYKNFIERVIEQETRQGLRAGFNWRPLKLVSWGVNTSLRFQKDKSNNSRNVNSHLSISRIPGINVRAALRANFLETGYLNSRIYGLRLSRNVFKKKVNLSAYFNMVELNYKDDRMDVQQKVAGMNCSVRVLKKLSLYFYYEGTYSKQRPKLTRLNTKIIQRF
ncbi:MAG: hypothetical protein AAFZ15_01250 [Bacteroidota bacterium]